MRPSWQQSLGDRQAEGTEAQEGDSLESVARPGQVLVGPSFLTARGSTLPASLSSGGGIFWPCLLHVLPMPALPSWDTDAHKDAHLGERRPRVLQTSPVRPQGGTQENPPFPEEKQESWTADHTDPSWLRGWNSAQFVGVQGSGGFSLQYGPTWWAQGWEQGLLAQKERAGPNGFCPSGVWRRKYGRNVP